MTGRARLGGVCQCCDRLFPLTAALKIPAHPWPDRDGRCHGARRNPLRLDWIPAVPAGDVTPRTVS
jgi:hypothetical protein